MSISAPGAEAEVGAGAAPAPALAWRGLLAIGAALAGVLLAVSSRYGFHRDELYFLVAGQYLDWGYPDQPPLLPLIMRLITEAFGESIVAVRLPAAVLSGAGAVIAALTAREMGGARRAQLLTAGAYAVCPFVVAVGHTLYTATIDLFVSSAYQRRVVAARSGGPGGSGVAGQVPGRGPAVRDRGRGADLRAARCLAPSDGGTTIFVGGYGKPYLDRFWSDVTFADRLDNGLGLSNREQGLAVWICRGQRAPWSVLWPEFKFPQ